ncbi:DUF998 domain-containing protein [Microbacterium sp. 179-I 3D2 NHS]|uniref:DUF998 domain-containing protein n=1 Tax=Microbacterium sp. 179-I 3D2 NHS TaxID=3235178 RepID=UPI0039A09121
MLILLMAIALLGVLMTLGSLLRLHALPAGLSPLSDPVSAYGISRYRGFYRAQTLGTALGAAALALGLVVADVESAVPAVVALLVLAAARALISWVPMDGDGAPRSGTGRAHNLLAFGAFAAASVGGFMTGIAFGATGGLEGASVACTALGWFMTAASALTLAAPLLSPLGRLFGLFERLIYVGMLAWMVVTAVTLLAR